MTYLDALQTTLAAEHAAVYVYGYLGAQTSASARPTQYDAIAAAYLAHRGRRDDLTSLVLELGGEPVAASAAYAVADLSGDPDGVDRAALALERDCAATYRYLVGSSAEGDARTAALDLLLDSAARALALGGAPETLPGT